MPGIGLDLEHYRPDEIGEEAIARVRRELALSDRDRLFLMIAEFNKGKRHRDAIRAPICAGRR